MDELPCPKKLKYLAMRKIVSSHYCFNNINNNHLLLPKQLFKELVEIGPSLVEMPENVFNDNFFIHNTSNFQTSLCYDHTYSKYFVVWVQTMHADNLAKYLPVVVHFIEIFFVIKINNVESNFLLCTKCFKLHLTTHSIDLNSERCKISKHYHHKTYISLSLQRELQNKIQSKNSWCNSCGQVPLFQVANYALCESIVGLTAHNCIKHYPIDENSDEFIYCLNCYGSGMMINFSLKKDIDISTFF